MLPIVSLSPEAVAIRLPRSGFKASGRAASEALNESGYLVESGQVREWRIASTLEEGSDLVYLGPAFQGTAIDESLAEASPEVAVAALGDLAGAFVALAAAGSLPSSFLSLGLLISPEGSVLVLPPRLVARALSSRAAADRPPSLAGLQSPQRGDQAAEASFFLAQLSYRALSGRDAYGAAAPGREAPTGAEEFVPLSLLLPGLDAGLASLVDRSLSEPRGTGPAEWVAVLAAAQARGILRELSPEEDRSAGRRAGDFEEALRRRTARRSFFRRRGALLGGLGAGLVVLVFVVGSIVAGQAGRPDFSGLSAKALVETYYKALDELDQEALEACGEGRALSADANFVMGLTVIGKTRMAYEQKDALVSASAWLAAGSPALEAGSLIHGIVDLAIEELPASLPGEAAFRTSYRFFAPGNEGSAGLPSESRRVDVLRLRETKRGWKIVGIERGGG